MILRLSQRAALSLAQGFQERWVRDEVVDGKLVRAHIVLHDEDLPVVICPEWGKRVVRGELVES